MYLVYILKSVNFQKFYTGYTDNFSRRLSQHNDGKSIYSRRYRPWKIIYQEHFDQQLDAVKRERYLKSAAGRRWLKNKFRDNINH
ncbi:MAG: GIY-YIG nuclease family protein [Patescibacteria group bacterium]